MCCRSACGPTTSGRGVVADELGRQQLLRGVKVLGVPGLYPAADDGLRDFCRHARVPFATKIRINAVDIRSLCGAAASTRLEH
jgi:hypothetical protein